MAPSTELLMNYGFLLGSGALLIQPSRKHHSPRIKITLIYDYYSSSKAVGERSARSRLIGSVAWAAAHEVGAGAPPVGPVGLLLHRVAFTSLLDYSFFIVGLISLYVNLTCGPLLVVS
jgi:hypothetical protein